MLYISYLTWSTFRGYVDEELIMKKIIILLLFSSSTFAGSLGNYGYEGCGYYRGDFGRVMYVCPNGQTGQRIFNKNMPNNTPTPSSSNYSIGNPYTPQQNQRKNQQAIDDIYKKYRISR